MKITNFEFKAKVSNLREYEQKLLTINPYYQGLDHQTDTYFNVPHGRLKLREGNIENALINYDRADDQGSKLSQVILYSHQPDAALKEILTRQFGVKTVVSKRRKIYFADNVKIHFDEVEHLGAFIEVEAISNNGEIPPDDLLEQCNRFLSFFGLTTSDLISRSYSDLLMEAETNHNDRPPIG